MAREKVLVSLAIETTRKAIFTTISQIKHEDLSVKLNYYSFLIKFLKDVNKLNDLLNYVAKEINKMLPTIIKSIDINNVESIDYGKTIYPFARGVEALGLLKKIDFIESMKTSLNIIQSIMESEYYFYLDIIQAVPLLQAVLSLSSSLRNIVDCRKVIDLTIGKFRALVDELDPSLNTIYARDIYFPIKLYKNEELSVSDRNLLLRDSKSKFLIRVIKSVDYLTAFKIDPPLETLDYLIRVLPRFFSDIFRITVDGKLEYYSTMIESIYALLQRYNNKDFANALLRSLIEESNWIISETDSWADNIKIILGTGLLVISKSAIYR